MEIQFLKAVDAASKGLDEFRAKFEKSLARKLSADWRDAAKAAVAAGVAAYRRDGAKASASVIEGAVANALRSFPNRIDRTVHEQTGVFYRGAVERFVRDHAEPEDNVAKGVVTTADGGGLYPETKRFVRKAKGGRAQLDFSLRDRRAIDALGDLTVNAASRYFPDQLKPKVAEVVRAVVYESGLSPEAAAVRLEAELRGALGTATEISSIIPARFATNPGAYFRTLASQSATLANSVGRISSMDEAGVEKFEIVAVRDSKTSAICRSLDRTIIAVRPAIETIDRLINFTGERQLERLLPYPKKGDAAPAAWASSIGFPPYHHGPCRSQVIAYVE